MITTKWGDRYDGVDLERQRQHDVRRGDIGGRKGGGWGEGDHREKIDVGHDVPALATRQPGRILSGKGQGQGESEVGRIGLWESLQIG